ncbi:MAG: hypothetical protein DI539_08420 [Flavobacterium psychrophilum]|nr:MAG: hypothetical protein DI539_08420 [Flavobacterium psychrophilum]
MDKNYIGIFIKTGVAACIFLVLNIVLYQFLLIPDQEFYYPLPLVYGFFLVFSLIILGVLIRIGKKNKEQLGYAFLLLTSVKMAASYFFARPMIAQSGENPTEKVNFFLVFILFLAIESYYTARLLNNKQ